MPRPHHSLSPLLIQQGQAARATGQNGAYAGCRQGLGFSGCLFCRRKRLVEVRRLQDALNNPHQKMVARALAAMEFASRRPGSNHHKDQNRGTNRRGKSRVKPRVKARDRHQPANRAGGAAAPPGSHLVPRQYGNHKAGGVLDGPPGRAVPWGLGGVSSTHPPHPMCLTQMLWGNGQAPLLLHNAGCFNSGNDIKSLISHKNSFLVEKISSALISTAMKSHSHVAGKLVKAARPLLARSATRPSASTTTEPSTGDRVIK